MQISVQIIGQDRLFAALDGLAKVALESRPWDDNKKLRFENETQHLDTQGSGTWPPLKPQTIARKTRDPRTTFLEILQQTGQLYRSLTQQGAAFNVTDERSDELAMGSREPKAALHHTGRGRLPVREVVRVTEEEVEQHRDLFVARKRREVTALGFEVV